MMALVAYDFSDDEDEINDSEDEISEPVIPATVNGKVEIESSSQYQADSLFQSLPTPSKHAVVEEDDEFLHKKETDRGTRKIAKITIPSLSEFNDVDQLPVKKPVRGPVTKSGLLGMLPAPKGIIPQSQNSQTKFLIPDSVRTKPQTVKAAPKVNKKPPIKPTGDIQPRNDANKHKSVISHGDSDDSDAEDADFFSLNKEEIVEQAPLPVDESEIQFNKNYGGSINNGNLSENVAPTLSVENEHEIEPSIPEMPSYNSSNNDDQELSEEAIRQLCGSRGKHKRENIQFIEVNQQEVLTNRHELITKNLSEDNSKRQSASKRRGDGPTSLQKRKHQITYLAHQAKANEAELQNQWSNNRMTKKQNTHSRHGEVVTKNNDTGLFRGLVIGMRTL